MWQLLILLLPLAALTDALSYRCQQDQVLVVQSFGNDTIRMHCQRLDLCGYEKLKCNYDVLQPKCGGNVNFVSHVSQQTSTSPVEHTCCTLFNPRPPYSVPTHIGNDCFLYELPDGSSGNVTEAPTDGSPQYAVLKSSADIPTQLDGLTGYHLRLFLLTNKSPPTLLVKGIERQLQGYRVTICRPKCTARNDAHDADTTIDVEGDEEKKWKAIRWSSWKSETWSSWNVQKQSAAERAARARQRQGLSGVDGITAVAAAGAIAGGGAQAGAGADGQGAAGAGSDAKGQNTGGTNAAANENTAQRQGAEEGPRELGNININIHTVGDGQPSPGPAAIANANATSVLNTSSSKEKTEKIPDSKEADAGDGKKESNANASSFVTAAPASSREAHDDKEDEKKNNKPSDKSSESGNTVPEESDKDKKKNNGKETEEATANTEAPDNLTKKTEEDKDKKDKNQGNQGVTGDKEGNGSRGDNTVEVGGFVQEKPAGAEADGSKTGDAAPKKQDTVNTIPEGEEETSEQGKDDKQPSPEKESNEVSIEDTSLLETTTKQPGEGTRVEPKASTPPSKPSPGDDSKSNNSSEAVGLHKLEPKEEPGQEKSNEIPDEGDEEGEEAEDEGEEEGGEGAGDPEGDTDEGGDDPETDPNNEIDIHGGDEGDTDVKDEDFDPAVPDVGEDPNIDDTVAIPRITPQRPRPNKIGRRKPRRKHRRRRPLSRRRPKQGGVALRPMRAETLRRALAAEPVQNAEPVAAAAADDPAGTGGTGARNCFAAHSLVTTAHGIKRMDQLNVGDYVLVPSSGNVLRYERVEMFYHREPQTIAEFLVFETQMGRRLSLTDRHLLPSANCHKMQLISHQHDGMERAMREARYASRAVVGECLLSVSTDGTIVADRIIKISRSTSQGIYSPMTVEGSLIADGVLTSCFSHFESHTVHKMIFDLLVYIKQFTGQFTLSPVSEQPVPSFVDYVSLLSHFALPFTKY